MPYDRLSKGSRANAVAVVLLLASILTKATAETRFVEVARQSGIDFTNVSGTPEKKYIIETQAAGVTTWDDDNRWAPCCYSLSRFAEAEARFRRASELDPTLADPLARLGWLLYEKQEQTIEAKALSLGRDRVRGGRHPLFFWEFRRCGSPESRRTS